MTATLAILSATKKWITAAAGKTQNREHGSVCDWRAFLVLRNPRRCKSLKLSVRRVVDRISCQSSVCAVAHSRRSPFSQWFILRESGVDCSLRFGALPGFTSRRDGKLLNNYGREKTFDGRNSGQDSCAKGRRQRRTSSCGSARITTPAGCDFSAGGRSAGRCSARNEAGGSCGETGIDQGYPGCDSGRRCGRLGQGRCSSPRGACVCGACSRR